MYTDLLVPTDGSERVNAALEHALDIAELTGATLHTLFVVDTRDYNTLPESRWLTVEEEARETGEAALDAVAERCEDRGVTVERALERGVPQDVILAHADEHGVDMVFMATHGYTGLDHFLHGSVTEAVIRHGTVPVVAIHVEEA